MRRSEIYRNKRKGKKLRRKTKSDLIRALHAPFKVLSTSEHNTTATQNSCVYLHARAIFFTLHRLLLFYALLKKHWPADAVTWKVVNLLNSQRGRIQYMHMHMHTRNILFSRSSVAVQKRCAVQMNQRRLLLNFLSLLSFPVIFQFCVISIPKINSKIYFHIYMYMNL